RESNRPRWGSERFTACRHSRGRSTSSATDSPNRNKDAHERDLRNLVGERFTHALGGDKISFRVVETKGVVQRRLGIVVTACSAQGNRERAVRVRAQLDAVAGRPRNRLLRRLNRFVTLLSGCEQSRPDSRNQTEIECVPRPW